MVKIENISQKGNVVTIDCYEEGDRNRWHHVEYNIDTWEILNNAQNNTYISHSMAKIDDLLRETGSLPEKACSYWY